MNKIIKVIFGYLLTFTLMLVSIPFFLVCMFLPRRKRHKMEEKMQMIALPLVMYIDRLVNY